MAASSPFCGSVFRVPFALTACCGGGSDGLTQQAAAQSEPEAQETPVSGPAPTEEQAPAAAGAPGIPGRVVAGDPDRGREVFVANGCMVCHGDAGDGGIGPTLARTSLDTGRAIEQVRRPRGVMLRYDVTVIPDEQAADILARLHTLALPDRIVSGEGTS